MNAEPDSSPQLDPATTPANTPVPVPEVTPTPTAEMSADESITQTGVALALTQESGLLASPPIKVPGFENLDTLLNEKDARSRGVFVLMHQEIVRLREVIREKGPFEKNFYDEREKGSVLNEQLENEKGRNAIKARGLLVADVWFGLSMAVGGTLICHAEAMPDGHTGAQVGYVVLAAVFAGAGAYTKWVMK